MILRSLAIAFMLLLPITKLRADSAPAPESHPFPWRTDYALALKEAQESGRPLLLKFTGSDWCPPCKRLNAEVFETDAMRTYAETEIIPVYVDFPRSFELPAKLARQNAALAETFGVEAYPSVWIVSPAGKALGRLGYQQGGAKSYIRSIKRILRDAARTEVPQGN